MHYYFPQTSLFPNPPLTNLLQNLNTHLLPSIQPPQPLIYQNMLIEARNFKIMQMRNICSRNQMFHQPSINMNQEAIYFKQETLPLKFACTISVSPRNKLLQTLKIPTPLEKPTSEQYLKKELENMMSFLLLNMGKNNQAEIDDFRKLYLQNPYLLQIYDKLVMKYFSAKRCREDIVRYILRKVFKKIRASIIKKEKVSSKKAMIIFCKKYFQKSFEKIQQSGVDVKNEDEIIEFVMPYKKNSKNKTMNTNFVLEIFSSQNFCEQYRQFLTDFETLLTDDNNKKKEKLIEFLTECIKKNSISKIGGFNRLPWLDVWIQDTKNIAFDLIPYEKSISDYKKIKNE